MSSRALRKLKQKEEFKNTLFDNSDESEDEYTAAIAKNKKNKKQSSSTPKFSMLNLDDNEDDDLNEDDDENNNNNEQIEEEQEVEEEEVDSSEDVDVKPKQQQQTKAKANKKKNKKKQQKNKKPNTTLDDIDKLVDEISSTTTTNNSTFSAINEEKKFRDILAVDPKNLNGANELKKLFGCKVSDMKELKKKNTNVHGNVNMMKKKSWMFGAPQPEWPEIVQSFVMELEKTEGDVNYFTIRWSESYRRLQDEFYEVLASHDPSHIAELLRYHPYHVDSLLQLSQVCLQTADYQHAGDFVERAVFAFEYCWHHLFNPSNGISRLEYKHQENKTCFLSVFRHIQILGRRGCPRTALEFCKVLLSLDYSDPLFVRLIIDYYAVKSRQYEFLVNLYTNVQRLTPNMTQTLDLLPNFCYNGALASFLKDDGESEESDRLLQKALIRFPMVLRPLLEKIKLNLLTMKDGKPYNLEEHTFFKSTNELLKPVEHLISLYVERSNPLWKLKLNAHEWLKKNVQIVVDMVNNKDPIIEESMQLVLKEYSVVDQSIFDHLFLSEYSDVIQRLPPDVIEMMRNEGFNNIQPPRGIDPRRGIGAGYQVYRAPRVIQQRQQVQQEVQQMQQQQFLEQLQQLQPNIDPNNPLLGFIQSLFPWNAQQAGQQQQQQQQQGARGFLDDYVDMIYEGEDDDNQPQQQRRNNNNNQRRR